MYGFLKPMSKKIIDCFDEITIFNSLVMELIISILLFVSCFSWLHAFKGASSNTLVDSHQNRLLDFPKRLPF